jgi:UDP-N-acetylglucosamine acyltransferase
MPKVHSTAIIEPGAELAADVDIGPFCLVGPHVRLGAGTRLISHVVITGHTTLGADNVVHPHAVLGGPPQDLKYKGEPTRLEIGDHNSIRELVTLNTGTIQDKQSGGVTRIGSRNLLMANVHFGHDCQLGSGCIIANNCMIAGHVHIGDRVVLLGGVGIHHFVSIGDFAYVAGGARIKHDIPPFVKIDEEGRIIALNKIGLARGGYAAPAIQELEAAVRTLIRPKKAMSAKIATLTRNGDASHPHSPSPDVLKLVTFIERRSTVRYGRYMESLRHA